MNNFPPTRRSFFKTRTIDVTFTIILGLFTFVFGYYVITSIRHSKAAKAKKAQVASTVVHHKIIHRQKKRRFIVSSKSLHPKISVADTITASSSQPTPVTQAASAVTPQIYADKNSIGHTTITAANPDEAKPVSVVLSTEKHAIKEAELPYTTYLKANETGVINMRKFDNYGSPIIKVIPTNAEVSVLEKGNSYYKVLFENTTGYVAKWNVLKK
jgi:hypothetical protein